METNLLDRMLSTYLTGQIPVTITLQNKIRVAGRIRAFDSYVIVLEGQKREIIYRHAISCLAASEEAKRPTQSVRPVPVKTASAPQRISGHKQRTPQRQAAVSASPMETSINNSMKEGLLKWMQEQKAAK
jgi:RNA chaperone Hfq